MWKRARRGSAARTIRRIALVVCSVGVVLVFAGPVLSGAVFLLLPTAPSATNQDLPDAYQPRHTGHIDLRTGLYMRRNEDLVVRGRPALVLRRTYVSGYRVSREFGIGTTHDGERYLVGDRNRFQWAELVLADGVRVRFDRTTPGTSIFGAMYEHRRSPGEWHGARLGWTGIHWALRRRDGSLMLFQGCRGTRACSIVRERDASGQVTHYRRDRDGRLMKMETSDHRSIAFDYDDKTRISRAYTSDHREIRYEYDGRGRLSVATADGGRRYRYAYTDDDEMVSIMEPGTDIENSFNADGRCVKQVNHYPDAEPDVYQLAYHIANGVVLRTDSERSDGTWLRYTWGAAGYASSEAWGKEGMPPAVFTYERDTITNMVTALTLTCPDRTGRPLRHTSFVRPGHEEAIKWDLLTTHCSWTRRATRARPAE